MINLIVYLLNATFLSKTLLFKILSLNSLSLWSAIFCSPIAGPRNRSKEASAGVPSSIQHHCLVLVQISLQIKVAAYSAFLLPVFPRND